MGEFGWISLTITRSKKLFIEDLNGHCHTGGKKKITVVRVQEGDGYGVRKEMGDMISNFAMSYIIIDNTYF